MTSPRRVGRCAPGRATRSFPGPVDNVRDLQVGDLNGDGAPDVVVPATNGSVVWVLLQER